MKNRLHEGKVRYNEVWVSFVFFSLAGGGRIFFHFFASRQVKFLFYFTKVINVFAAAYISLHDPQKGKTTSITVCLALHLLICSSSAQRKKF